MPWDTGYVAIDNRDANDKAESVVLLGNDSPRWVSWDLTDLTSAWLDTSAANYGVILFADNDDTFGYELRFNSSEATFDKPYLQIIWTQPTKTVYFLKDHLGSVRATVDDIGQVVGYDDYDPWGLAMAGRSMATGTSTVDGAAKNKFIGKELDDEFGLDWNYFEARYYDPVIGRFLSVDLLASEFPSLSTYNYAVNNPQRFIDPGGKGPESPFIRALLKFFFQKGIKTRLRNSARNSAIVVDVAMEDFEYRISAKQGNKIITLTFTRTDSFGRPVYRDDNGNEYRYDPETNQLTPVPTFNDEITAQALLEIELEKAKSDETRVDPIPRKPPIFSRADADEEINNPEKRFEPTNEKKKRDLDQKEIKTQDK